MPKKEEILTKKIERVVELVCYPLLMLIPYAVLREYFINYPLTQGLALDIFKSNPADPNYTTENYILTLLFPFLCASGLSGLMLWLKYRDPEAPLDFTIRLFLIEIFFFGSFIVIFRSFESFRLPQQTLAQCGVYFVFALYLLAGLIRGRLRITYVRPLYLAAGAVTAVCALSLLWTPNHMVTVKELMHYLAVVLFCFLLLQHFQGGRQLLNLLIALVLIISSIEAAIGVGQHYGLNMTMGLGLNYDSFSTLGNKNYVAELLAMLIPFSIGCLFYARNPAVKLLFALNIVMMLVNVIVTQTRGSWFGLFGGLLVFIAVMVPRLDGGARKKLGVGVAAVLLVAVGMITLSENGVILKKPGVSYVRRVTNIFKKGDLSIQSRLFIWGGTYEMIKDWPATGVGFGAYKIRYLDSLKSYIKSQKLKSIPGFFRDVNAKEAHNEYLHVLSELGPPGIAAFLWFIFELVRFFFAGFRKCADPGLRIVLMATLGGLVSIGLSALFGFPYHIVPTTMFICALIVIAISIVADAEAPAVESVGAKPPAAVDNSAAKNAKKKKKPKEEAAPPPKPAAPAARGAVRILSLPFPAFISAPILAIVAAAAITLGIFSWNIQKANIELKTANWFSEHGNAGEAKNRYDLSNKLDTYNGDIHLFLGMYHQRMKELDLAIKELQVAESYYDLPQVELDLGAAYFEKGTEFFKQAETSKESVGEDGKIIDNEAKGTEFYKLAANAFKESLAVFPNYPLPRYNLGLIHYQLGDYDKAIAYLKEAIKVQQSFDTAYFKLALAYERMGKLDLAEDYYRQTVKVNPNHSDAYYNLGLLYAQRASNENNLAGKAKLQGRLGEANKHTATANAHFDKAKGLFEKAVSINNGHVRAMNNLANIYFREGNKKMAENLYQKALSFDPSYVNSRMNLALLFLNDRRFTEAIPYLEPIVASTQPPLQEIKARYMLGSCYSESKRKPDAVNALMPVFQKYSTTEFTKSVEYAGAIIRLAESLSNLNRYQECYQVTAAGFSYGEPSQETEWLYRAGLCAMKTGDRGSAARNLGALIQKYPNSQQGAWARANIAQVQ